MQMHITISAYRAMLAHGGNGAPLEVCGLLFGTADQILEARPAANVHSAPATHFELDPAALIAAHRAARGAGPQLLGHYHSHPSGRPEPSAIDRAASAGDGRIWAIIAADAVALWRDTANGFEPLCYRLTSG